MHPSGKMRVTILVLAILLGISVLALGGTFIYRYITAKEPATVILPDNLIDSEQETGTEATEANSTGTVEAYASSEPSKSRETVSQVAESVNTQEGNIADALSLHKRNDHDNIPFQVTNMFPGDAETKYFCIRVFYKGDITVRYHADIRDGYEKLAEVLKVRIRLLDTDETLYDGLMRDMPASLNHPLKTGQSTQSDLYYEITTYLDTSVGNEYMDKNLIADFRWWVEETGNLEPPKTGDRVNLTLWVSLLSVSLFSMLLVLIIRRKEETDRG